MEMVCKAACAGKQTFYKYFNDKHDLCTQLLISVWNRWTNDWETGLQADQAPEATMTSRLDRMAPGGTNSHVVHDGTTGCVAAHLR